MDRLIYILDTNVIADRINGHKSVTERLTKAGENDHIIGLCPPVQYEVLRGLFKTNATRKLQLFNDTITPLLDAVPLVEADWRQAAQFWADMRNQGRQFADTDLLIAAVAKRLDGIVVSDDDDFDVLPIQRENWRETATFLIYIYIQMYTDWLFLLRPRLPQP